MSEYNPYDSEADGNGDEEYDTRIRGSLSWDEGRQQQQEQTSGEDTGREGGGGAVRD